jgi:heme-degrading monooxygenase HmoA
VTDVSDPNDARARRVTVFRSRLRPDAEGYDDTADAMEARARHAPGFVDFKTFVAADGERVSIIVFATPETHDAWRRDAAHRDAQRRGREDWYAEYLIQVCDLVAERRFPAPPP